MLGTMNNDATLNHGGYHNYRVSKATRVLLQLRKSRKGKRVEMPLRRAWNRLVQQHGAAEFDGKVLVPRRSKAGGNHDDGPA